MYPKEKIVHDILQQLNPDRDALLKLISSQMTEEMLIDIARADNVIGNTVTQNLEALKSIISNTIIPTNKDLDYEVLCLTSYRNPNSKQESENKEDHLERAFSCIILLITDSLKSDDYSYDNSTSPDYNLIQLVESVNYLGKDFQLAMIAFLAWELNANANSLHSFFDEGDVNNIISIFTLIFFLLKTSYIIKEDDLKTLIDCLIDGAKQAEIIYNKYAIYKDYNKEFLGIFDPKYESKQYTKWIKIAKELPQLATHLKDENLVNALQKISDLIAKNEHLYKE